ncbi:hypothetical protein PF272_01150 [Gallibacterium sp. AGMB14963]|nr:hypothetical protein [Gallibacterium sp. AGMB14963]
MRKETEDKLSPKVRPNIHFNFDLERIKKAVNDRFAAIPKDASKKDLIKWIKE